MGSSLPWHLRSIVPAGRSTAWHHATLLDVALLGDAVLVDEADLHVFSIRKRERIGEPEMGAGAIGIVVDLVGLADDEQPPVAQAQPAQAVRADRLGGPLLDRSV